MRTVLLAGIVLVTRASQDALYPSFDEYIRNQGLSYTTGDYQTRRRIYEDNINDIQEHNAKTSRSWTAAVNEYTASTQEEMEDMTGYMKTTGGQSTLLRSPAPLAVKDKALPENFDWRQTSPSVVTPVKNQGSCGSCWAFSATSVIESAVAIETGKLFDLSPQQIASCMPNPEECGGAGGCRGATAQLAFNYTIQTGLTSIWTWPYFSGIMRKDGTCFGLRGRKTPVAGITGYQQLAQNDPHALMKAVLVSPVSVSVAASRWSMYGGGVFDGCSTSRPIINHAVVLMGYGYDKQLGSHFWTVRNSWGVGWGESGYIRVMRYPEGEPCGIDDKPLDGYSCKSNPPESIRACGMCGILADSAYPTGAYAGLPQGPPDDPAIDTNSKREVPEMDVANLDVTIDRFRIAGRSLEVDNREAGHIFVPVIAASAVFAVTLLLVDSGRRLSFSWRRAPPGGEYLEAEPLTDSA